MNNQFHLLPYLPQLTDSGFSVTSPVDPNYNCIAWAAGDSERWWEPSDNGYWPETAPRILTLDAFLIAFRSVGFSECDSSDYEAGFEKIAIYADQHGPQHAARQLTDGTWTSKLGRHEDIVHLKLEGVESPLYGRAVKFMKRPAAN